MSQTTEVSALVVLWMALLLPTATLAQGCDPNSPAIFIAGITVLKGQLRLEHAGPGEFSRVRLVHPERLAPCLHGARLDEKEVLQALASDLDSALSNRKLFYWYDPTQSDEQKAKLKPAGTLAQPKLAWKVYFEAYKAEVGAARAARTWSWFRSNLNTDIGALALPKQNTPSDQTNAELTFNVVAPNVRWRDKLPAPEKLPTRLQAQREALADYLDQYDAGLWRREKILALLSDYFTRRGWNPTVSVSPADAPPPRITITDSLSIVQVTFSPPIEERLRQPVLYLLLPANRYALAKDRPVCQHAGLKYASVDLSAEPLPCADDKHYVLPAPFPMTPFNQIAFEMEQPLVGSLGFTVTPLMEPGGVNLQVERNAPTGSVGSNQSQTAEASGKPTPSTPASAVAAGQGAPPGLSSGMAKQRPAATRACAEQASSDDQSCGSVIPPRDKRGFVGAGFDYNPGQGFHPIAAAEYQRLTGPGSFSIKTGSANDLLFLQGSAAFDFAAFRSLQHRLSLNLKGGTEANNNRLIREEEFDERRNGGNARLDLELYRNDLGNSLTLYAEGVVQNVELTRHGTVSGGQAMIADTISDTLASGSVGALYTISGDAREIPFRIQFEPRLQLGDGRNGTFFKATVLAIYHQDLLGPYAFHIQGHFADASHNTPIYELPSFGGSNVMRGFRMDDVLGRRYWSVQPEFWFPVPFTTAGIDKFSAFLSRNVRMAGLFDWGGVYQILGHAPPGMKSGPGAGLRVNYHGATMAFDWGYGLGQVESGRGHGRVYFSLSKSLF